jgi:ElaB/YqjD/DUF883 family membrane-anchored ribosome-binding protein
MSQTTVSGEPGTTSESGVVGQAQEMVQEKAQEARGAAASAVCEQVEQRSTQVGSQVGEVAEALRGTSETLRSQDKEVPAKVLDAITDRVEPMGRYLSEASADRLLGDAEHFGRRNPWVVIAGGFTVGVLVSRLLKASSSRRFEELHAQGYSSRHGDPSYPPRRNGGRAGSLEPAPLGPGEAAGTHSTGGQPQGQGGGHGDVGS